MAEQTKRGDKFKAARQFIKANPRIAARLQNWQKMKGETLYRALNLMGVEWSTLRKVWSGGENNNGWIPEVVAVAPAQKEDGYTTVRVRIIADEKVINKSLSNLLEMAGALDWTLVRNSGIRKGHYGSGRLVYLTFRLPSA